ncbi:YeeE/YedE thiosulfate transporter family protein [Blastomonas sp. SL216]|uniref:YeeE/YedE thiosulfate transporter family protein n=1 Tax=Blastomonas sp. SL216 TaxID=2995169 RepID=UPI002377A810|nr:YeeE/YedE thiosulfate transporter family protein [Blastomonas sp. SL216]
MLLIALVACAFLVGLSIGRGSTCAVTAAKEVVFKRHGTMLIGFVLAASAAGLVTYPLGWLSGSTFHVTADVPVSAALVVGAVLIGVGAVINDACLLGTLARIGQGEIHFLALPVGLALGFGIADQQAILAAGVPIENPHAMPSLAGGLIVAVFGGLLIAGWWYLGRQRKVRPDARTWSRGVMVVMGVCGALLFGLEPHWSYPDAVHAAVARNRMDLHLDIRALAIALALVAGSVCSAALSGAFVLQKPTFALIGRSILGGAVMAFGGTLIPGGNDSLLLAAIPSGTLSGLAAYGIMTVTVPAVLWLSHARRSPALFPAR